MPGDANYVFETKHSTLNNPVQPRNIPGRHKWAKKRQTTSWAPTDAGAHKVLCFLQLGSVHISTALEAFKPRCGDTLQNRIVKHNKWQHSFFFFKSCMSVTAIRVFRIAVTMYRKLERMKEPCWAALHCFNCETGKCFQQVQMKYNSDKVVWRKNHEIWLKNAS